MFCITIMMCSWAFNIFMVEKFQLKSIKIDFGSLLCTLTAWRHADCLYHLYTYIYAQNRYFHTKLHNKVAFMHFKLFVKIYITIICSMGNSFRDYKRWHIPYYMLWHQKTLICRYIFYCIHNVSFNWAFYYMHI